MAAYSRTCVPDLCDRLQLRMRTSRPMPQNGKIGCTGRCTLDLGFHRGKHRVLVLGSGNVVHNLHAYGWGRHVVKPYDWAVRFEERLRALLEERDLDAI